MEQREIKSRLLCLPLCYKHVLSHSWSMGTMGFIRLSMVAVGVLGGLGLSFWFCRFTTLDAPDPPLLQLFGVVGGVALGLFNYYIVHSFLVHPISRLIRAMEEVSIGNIDQSMPDKENDLIGQLYQSMNRLTTSSKHDRSQLVLLAATDPLTGVWNRRGIDQILKTEFARSVRYNYCLSVMMIDLDNYKAVNDMYGHGVGDDVLRSLVITIQSCLREIDKMGRYGGDEFVIILPQTNDQQAQLVVERLVEAVRREQFISMYNQQLSLCLTVSIGIAVYPIHHTELDQLMMYADQAMYRIKKQGGNGYQFYS